MGPTMPAESAHTRLARLLLLVPWLKANPGITINEAADAHRVTPEQLMRDLSELYTTEVPGMYSEGMLDIAYCRSDFSVDGDCRIYVREARRLDRPTQLSSEQVSQLIVALDAASASFGSSDPSFATARAKLAQLLPNEHERSAAIGAVGPGTAVDVGRILREAVADDSAIEIDYVSDGADTATSRCIEPVRIRSVADRVWVDAWCQSARQWRTFRADRIERVRRTGLPRLRPESETAPPESRLADSFTVEVIAVVGPGSAWVVDGLPGAQITPEPDGSQRVRFLAGSVEWVARWALRFADRVRLVEPQSAAHLTRARATEALGQWDTPSGG